MIIIENNKENGEIKIGTGIGACVVEGGSFLIDDDK